MAFADVVPLGSRVDSLGDCCWNYDMLGIPNEAVATPFASLLYEVATPEAFASLLSEVATPGAFASLLSEVATAFASLLSEVATPGV